tara:strand:+ start:92 stop:346 length:255 start_codon:yes stop_codon:yes gene_type:complete
MILEINDDFRITDNKNEYRIERWGGKSWQPVAFCTTSKSLIATLREKMADRAAHNASICAHSDFDTSSIPKELSALSDKRGDSA